MKRPEFLSRILITAAMIGVVGAPILIWSRTPLVHAKIAESGGWNPDIIRVDVGKPFTLHLTSDDVVHGFAVGQMDMQSVDVLPGKVTDITLNFDKPGIYTFFCTRWCGLNHWRMRGTIEVGGSGSDLGPAPAPLYVSLGLDIDAPHETFAGLVQFAKLTHLGHAHIGVADYVNRVREPDALSRLRRLDLGADVRAGSAETIP